MTLILTIHVIATVVYSGQIIGQLSAVPYNNKVFSLLNETTTAIPPYNVSKNFTIGHTPTTPTSMSTTIPTTNAEYPTRMTLDGKSSILSRNIPIVVSSIISTLSSDQEATTRHYFVTTTAAPPSVEPSHTYHQFNGLSFAGGALVAIGLVVLGTFAWKMYIARIERSYWTL